LCETRHAEQLQNNDQTSTALVSGDGLTGLVLYLHGDRLRHPSTAQLINVKQKNTMTTKSILTFPISRTCNEWQRHNSDANNMHLVAVHLQCLQRVKIQTQLVPYSAKIK